MIAILFIISPLAFIAFIFTPFRSHFTKWRDSFVKWSFIGLGAAFFLNLATGILRAFFNTSSSTGALIIGTPGEIVELIFKLLIVTGFMITGLKLLAKADGIAKLVMAAAAAVVAAIVTGGASVMGSAGAGALKIAGNSKYGEAIKERSQRFRNNVKDIYSTVREGIGLDKTGTTAMNQKQRNANAIKQYESLAAAQSDETVAHLAANANNSDERAAYGQELMKRKKTHLITDPEVARKIMENNEKYGMSNDEFEKANYKFAVLNKKNVGKEKASLVGKSTGKKDASGNDILFTKEDRDNKNSKNYQAMQDAAEEAAKISAIKKMNASHISALKTIDLNILKHAKTKTLREATKSMDGSQLEQITNIKNAQMEKYESIAKSQLAFLKAKPRSTWNASERADFQKATEQRKDIQKVIENINVAIK